MCLNNKEYMLIEVKIKLDYGVEAVFELPTNESAGAFAAVEEEISIIGNLSTQLHKEMGDLRKTGHEEHVISSATTTKVIVFGVVSVGVIVASAIIQILYLRRFFREKKIM